MDKELNSDKNNIKLGGFPPIFFINKENKKIREFNKKIEEKIDIKIIDKLNILNIKNILGNKK